MVSAAVALVATGEEIEIEEAVGEAPAGVATRFDFASVTKPIVATLGLVLDAEGSLPLATRIGDVWPEAHARIAPRPLSDLLRNRSGVAAWTPLYHRCRSLKEAEELIVRGGRDGDLVGARADTYSDLGFFLYG
ncbi:MAG TPA: serine hydrolase domain-containing protein, partial [Thermoanaerobaculia bacterium]|nr:serine hydrolase domain-containing protein [Thermoanaerobaculia bacterium]